MKFRSLALALLVVLAGCNAFAPPPEDDAQPKVFRSVFVTNEDTVPHTVDVVVLHDGDIVYWTVERIEAKRPASETNFTFDIVDSARITSPAIENTTRQYVVLLRLENQTSGVRYDVPETRLSECYSIGAKIQGGTIRGPIVSHWNDDIHDYCAEPWNETTSV